LSCSSSVLHTPHYPQNDVTRLLVNQGRLVAGAEELSDVAMVFVRPFEKMRCDDEVDE
jgi:hypothetical protein